MFYEKIYFEYTCKWKLIKMLTLYNNYVNKIQTKRVVIKIDNIRYK